MSIKFKPSLKIICATALLCCLTLFSVAAYAFRYNVVASNGERVQFSHDEELDEGWQRYMADQAIAEDDARKAAAAYKAEQDKKSVISKWFDAPNVWECILDDMPGVQNDQAARQIKLKCHDDDPNVKNKFNVEKKSSMFGVMTANECTIKYSRDTSSPTAAKWIRIACRQLYPTE